MKIAELDTPALLVDLDVMERNLSRVADYCAANGLRLRPHTKTHKSTMLAKKQMALGAKGVTVAKVSEAEVMLAAEPEEILVAYPLIGAPKLRRLAEVAKKTRVLVAVDSLSAAQGISEVAAHEGVKIGILTEVDVGLHRAGVAPSEAVALSQAIAALPGIEWRGVAFYPGHIKEQNAQLLSDLQATVSTMLAEFRAAGLTPEIVSGGSTPALWHSHEIPGLTEIRPGTYIFNDINTLVAGACAMEDCAASILVTVVSHAAEERMLIDGGSKTFSSDKLVNGGAGHGYVVEAPGAFFHRMNEEHGFVDLTRAERSFAVGDKVRVIPNHICVAINLHERVYGVRGDEVEMVWQVEARGKLQ